MTDQEAKEWLDWTVEKKLCEITESKRRYRSGLKWGDAYYLILSKKRIHIASVGETVIVSYALQLVLQEEIKQLGWSFEIYQTPSTAECIIRCPARYAQSIVKTFPFEADTILEAMMRAFREAWEATK